MKIEVVPHEEIKPLLRAWRQTLGDTRQERDRRFREMWAAFVQRIVDASGPPPDAIADPTVRPTRYLCSFPEDGFAELVVEPDRRTGWFTIVRRVIVINLIFSPGPPG